MGRPQSRDWCVSNSESASISFTRPKVHQFDLAIGGEQNIVGLDVAVNEADFMCLVQPLGHLTDDLRIASFSVSWFSRSSFWPSVSPSTNSITRKGDRESRPNSMAFTMLG